jgi:CheY-like chemotaxis protein
MPIELVMVVDDEPDIRAIAELSLASVGGWRVVLAGSGEEALARLDEQRPDLVLLDVMMPGADGPTVLGRLRALEQGEGRPPLPVILMTAKTQKLEIEEYLAMGARGVITKPFDPMTLPEQIRRILGEQ